MTKFEEKAYGLIIFLMFIALLTVFVPASNAQKVDDNNGMYGRVDVQAMNAGVLKLSGTVTCKKYFDKCVLKEHWFGPILSSRDTVSVDQMVIMRTGVSHPTIISVEDNGDKILSINFAYEDTNHTHWIPVYED